MALKQSYFWLKKMLFHLTDICFNVYKDRTGFICQRFPFPTILGSITMPTFTCIQKYTLMKSSICLCIYTFTDLYYFSKSLFLSLSHTLHPVQIKICECSSITNSTSHPQILVKLLWYWKAACQDGRAEMKGPQQRLLLIACRGWICK